MQGGRRREKKFGEGRGKDMKNRQIDRKTTKQVRIDAGVHKLLKIDAAQRGESIREVLEGLLADYLRVKSNE